MPDERMFQPAELNVSQHQRAVMKSIVLVQAPVSRV